MDKSVNLPRSAQSEPCHPISSPTPPNKCSSPLASPCLLGNECINSETSPRAEAWACAQAQDSDSWSLYFFFFCLCLFGFYYSQWCQPTPSSHPHEGSTMFWGAWAKFFKWRFWCFCGERMHLSNSSDSKFQIRLSTFCVCCWLALSTVRWDMPFWVTYLIMQQ